MTDWIAWTKCPGCGYSEKDVFQKPDDAPERDAASFVRCPHCESPARVIIFPAFDIQTFDISQPGAMYDTIDDW